MSYKLLIDGALVDGAGTIDVINPATEQVLAICPRADAAQLDAAVAAAKAAFPAWSGRSYQERAALIAKLADELEGSIGDMARLLTQEQGKPLDAAMGEILGAVALLRGFAAMELPVKVLRDNAQERVLERRAPLGVVAAITPWNFPVLLLMSKVGPALLSGNSMVLKPAPTTPLTTLRFAEICARILPPGVVNVIVDANDLGDRLTSHPDVAKVSFTGSTATGRKVMGSVSSSLKRLTLELGGNDAAIVLDDVDVRYVAPKLFGAAMINSGQVCLAAKRAYVPDALYDEMCDELGRLAREAIVDDGLKQGTQYGPVQNAAQYEKVKSFLEDARENGTIIAGGEALDRPGYFIAPTIVKDMPDNARLVREEQFGPVLPVLRYSDIDDVIARANDSEFGLGGTIWCKDVKRGEEVAMKISTGTCWVNKHMDIPVDIPFRGARQSGMGAESGIEGLHEYSQAMIVNIAKG